MRYQNWIAESLRNSLQDQRLRKVVEREYFIRGTPIQWQSPGIDNEAIKARVSGWVSSHDGKNRVRISIGLQSSYGHRFEDIGQLTDDELIKVAKIRREIMRWERGEIDSLPETID